MSTHIPRVSPAYVCATTAVAAAININANAGLGYIAGSVFTIINPIGGAVFGATFALTNMVADGILGAVGCNSNTALKIAKFVIAGALSAVAATFAVAAVGFPITFTAAAMLVGGMVLVNMAITMAIKAACCLCITGFSDTAFLSAGNGSRPDANFSTRMPTFHQQNFHDFYASGSRAYNPQRDASPW
ncbi:MAG: hypothetical protein NTX49_00895 [Chlamydiae bacterium]|nr:hypothetical protein [Chlamydiota bacterium]